MKKLLNWLKAFWALIVALVGKGCTKVKTVKWTRTKVGIAGAAVALVVVALVMAQVFRYYHRQPAAATTNKAVVKKVAVVENPTKQETKKAVAAVTENSNVAVTGKARLARGNLQSGDTVKVPVAGTVKTTYIDSKTKKQIGEGDHKVTGETVVALENDKITANTTINDTSQVAIVQRETKKRNELGYFYDGDQKIEYKRNIISFEVWKVQADGYIGGELDIDDIGDSKVKTGVRVRW